MTTEQTNRVDLSEFKDPDDAPKGADYDPDKDEGIDAQASTEDAAEQAMRQVAAMDTRELLQIALASSFAFIAARRGEHWMLTDPERDNLAAAWSPVLDTYLGELGQTPLGVACIVTVTVVAPRAMLDAAKRGQDPAPEDPPPAKPPTPDDDSSWP